MPKNRNHFEKQGTHKSSPSDPDLSQLTVNIPNLVMLLLSENRLIVPKPQPAKKR